MKLKGISIFEQHVEKAVLALFVVVAAALFVMQFTASNEVSIGADAYPPERLDEVISQKAQAVGARLQGDFEDDELPPSVGGAVGADPDAEVFWNQIADASGGLYNASDGSGTESTTPEMPTGPAVGTDLLYAVHDPPAPEPAVGIAEAATIDPFVPLQFPGAAALLPAQQPLDEWYVSVQSSFDAPRFVEMLGSIPEDEEILPLNPTWWQNTVALVAVDWERERLLDDGTWGERTMLDPLPGRETMNDVLSESDIQPARRPELEAMERERREAIRRPAMYPIISGPQWVFPAGYRTMHGMDAPAGAEGIDPEQARLERRIRGIYNEMQRIQRSIQNIQEELGRNNGPSRGTGPTRGRTSMLTPGDAEPFSPAWPAIPERWLAQRTTPDGDDNDDADAEQRRRDRLQSQMTALQERLAGLQTRFDEACASLEEDWEVTCNDLLGIEDENANTRTGPVAPVFDEPLADLEAMTTPITLWAHDLTVEPGATYRYRASVRTLNPFFGYATALSEEQRDLASRPTVSSEPGEWGQPITTMPETFIRVVDASPASMPVPGTPTRPRTASAQVEVYRFFYGYWRPAGVQLKPGDLVVAEIELPELPIFEIDDAEGGPTVTGQENLDPMLEISSDLVMSGVFESAGRRSSSVLFSTFEGKTRIATQIAGVVGALIDRSREASADAVVLTPGTGAAPNTNRPGGRPGATPGGRPALPAMPRGAPGRTNVGG